jgi:hypothetical protein
MDFGIDILNGLAKASVFMDVDVSGIVDFQLTAGPTTAANNTSQAITSSSGGNATVPSGTTSSTAANNTSQAIKSSSGGNATVTNDTTSSTAANKTSSQSNQNTAIPKVPVPGNGQTSSNGTASINGSSPLNSSSSSNRSSTAASAQATASSLPAQATPAPVKRSIIERDDTVQGKRAAESVNGCVQVTGSIAVNGGLDGALSPLFSKSVNFPIFQTSVPLLQVSHHSNLLSYSVHLSRGEEMLWQW